MKALLHRSVGAGRVGLVATFGNAQLVKHINGRYELRGGSAADHTDAIGWISLFLHEAVVSCAPPVRDIAFLWTDDKRVTVQPSPLWTRRFRVSREPKTLVNVFPHYISVGSPSA